MELTVGTVVEGKVVVEGPPLEEGATVAVLIAREQSFTASPSEEAELLEAMKEARRGDVVDGWELLREIKGDS